MVKSSENDLAIKSEGIELLRKVFPSLLPEDLIDLTKEVRVVQACKDSYVYKEGDSLKGCFFILRGIVKIYKTGLEGRKQIIRFDQSSDLFGFRSLIEEEHACTTVQCLTDTMLILIPKESFICLLKKRALFTYHVMKMICKELGEANSFLQEFAQRSVRARLAEALVRLEKDFGVDTQGALALNLSREDLAAVVGTATESVIRLLSEFKSTGTILIQGRKIIIKDMIALKQIAQM